MKKGLKYFVIIIICCSVICLGVGVMKFNDKNNFTLEIVDESTIAPSALEKFYEDDDYEYYFSSVRSDSVYAVINGKEKYLVKDLLNNNSTKYNITISKLKDAGLKFYAVTK